MEPVEKLLRVRPPRLGEQHLAAKLWEELRELLGIARLVEEVGPEDEIPWGRTEQRLRLAPANTGNANEDAVALGIPPQQLDRFLRPVGREHLAAAERRGERRQPEAATELENPQTLQVATGDVTRESETARPELGPVRQELLLVECRLVDQLLRARRADDLEPQAGRELDLLFDEVQSVAKRSTGTPSGSLSCA